MSDEKIYCGSGKIVPTQYGEMTKISFHKDDINKMVGYMKSNNLDWCNLVLKEKREKVEGKATHYLEIDTWKPTQQTTPAPVPFQEIPKAVVVPDSYDNSEPVNYLPF